jgi:hypothetical protein
MLYIYTFLTDETRIKYLKETAELNNLEIYYIKNENWNGYIDKIIAVNNIIKQLNDNDIVCFIDAYDVLVNNNMIEIINNFENYNCDLLLGAELNCYPELYINKFNNTSTNYKYVNSGGYIGYKWAIQKIFDWKSLYDIYNICKNGGDQTYFIEYFLEHHSDKIKLDDKCRIFQNMHWVNWNEISFISGKMYNTILNTKPCFIHFNGGSFLQNNKENIMPIFIEKMKESMLCEAHLNLNNYEQIITSTCFPHSQI